MSFVYVLSERYVPVHVSCLSVQIKWMSLIDLFQERGWIELEKIAVKISLTEDDY